MPKPTILDSVAEAFREACNELASDIENGHRQLDAEALQWLGYSFHYELNRLAKERGQKMITDA